MEDYSKISNEELMAMYKQKFPQGVPKQQAQAQPDIMSLLAQQKPTMGQRVQGGVGNMMKTGAEMLTGVSQTPKTDTFDNNDIMKLILSEKIKQQYKDPNYVVSYDADGKPVFTQAPGDIKNAPFYSSEMGGRYYGAKTGEAEANAGQATTETNLMNKVMPQVDAALSGQPGSVVPGTKINVGPISMPVNPEFTEGEASRISALPTMNKLSEEIKQIVQSPEYMEGNKWKHAMRGIAVDRTDMPFLTMGDKFSSNLQSKLANLKTTFFAEGGKALTQKEIGILSPLIEISGKSPERIVQDYNTFMVKYNEFVKAKQGGMMGYNPGQPSSPPPQSSETSNPFDGVSDEELRKIAGV